METNDSLTTKTANPPAYTVAEFAALFGRHKGWAYRLIYAGQIEAIDGFGVAMVPANQVDRILATARRRS